MLLVILICIILVLVIVLFRFRKELKKIKMSSKLEIAASLQSKVELGQFFEEQQGKLKKYISHLEQTSRNFGEITTHKILTDLQKELVDNKVITDGEMIVVSNVYIPYSMHGKHIHTRQIDHLVLLKTGIYIIETKYWKGRVLHGINENYSGDYKFLIDFLSNDQTFVFTKESESNLKVASYNNPENQVKKTAVALKELIKAKYVEPIIFFGYPKDNLNEVIDYSEDKHTKRFTSKEMLVNHFEKELQNKKATYSTNELINMQDILNQVNYLE